MKTFDDYFVCSKHFSATHPACAGAGKKRSKHKKSAEIEGKFYVVKWPKATVGHAIVAVEYLLANLQVGATSAVDFKVGKFQDPTGRCGAETSVREDDCYDDAGVAELLLELGEQMGQVAQTGCVVVLATSCLFGRARSVPDIHYHSTAHETLIRLCFRAKQSGHAAFVLSRRCCRCYG